MKKAMDSCDFGFYAAPCSALCFTETAPNYCHARTLPGTVVTCVSTDSSGAVITKSTDTSADGVFSIELPAAGAGTRQRRRHLPN